LTCRNREAGIATTSWAVPWSHASARRPTETQTDREPHLRTERGAGGSIVDLYTSSTVWLREGGGLNGHVGPEEADANLDTIVGLTGVLAPRREESVRLRLEGGTFARERPRLEERLRIGESIEVEE
jgi:hypothetical protein